jgi:hypothetical protein
MSTRRNLLKGALATATLFGIQAVGLRGTDAALADDTIPVTWDKQRLANTRVASPSEFINLALAARAAAVSAGYPRAEVAAAVATATMSISPRATQVGKCALVIDGAFVFVYTKEFGANRYDRHAVQVLWTDGQEYLSEVHPSQFVHGLSSAKALSVAAATSTCCYSFSSGQCCTYDFKALFECCGPCAFGGPTIYTVACVIIWCNYCAVANCTEYYHQC